MPFRSAGRGLAAVVVTLAASLQLLPGPSSAGPPRTFRFEAAPRESLLVHGEYPPVESRCVNFAQPLLHARFRGAIEVGKATDASLYLIGELGLEDYLKGIAEVPRHWPFEALKAQVVAARSYALVRLERGSSEGEALGYDLCATQACQVYAGMGVEAGAWGERWVRAVEETAGEVLLHAGRPAETFYSSTSNGRTYPNEAVLGGPPQPYLRGVVERDDGESPLSRWSVAVPFGDLARFLGAAGVWSGGPIERVAQRDGRIVVSGGERIRLSREDLRDALNDVASCLDPDYPTTKPDGYRLPQTVPSDWYTARQEGASIVLEGRGWGHGVGMVQWGAKGKADRGLSYAEILAAYYGGLRPVAIETPESIRVLVADDLASVTVVPSGDAAVRGARAVPPAPWRVSGGRRIRLSTGETPSPELEATAFTATGAGDDRVRGAVDVSGSARVRLEFLREDRVAGLTPWRPYREGSVRLEAASPGLPAGRYEVRAAVSDGVDLVRTPALPVRLSGAAAPATPTARPASPPAPSDAAQEEMTPPGGGRNGGGLPLLPIGAAVAGLIAIAAAARAMRRAPGAHRRR